MFLTSTYWLKVRSSWSATLNTFLQSKLSMPGSLHSSGPVYRKLRMSPVVKLESFKLLSTKCLTVGFLKVSWR